MICATRSDMMDGRCDCELSVEWYKNSRKCAQDEETDEMGKDHVLKLGEVGCYIGSICVLRWCGE